jgi:hypothetical protein
MLQGSRRRSVSLRLVITSIRWEPLNRKRKDETRGEDETGGEDEAKMGGSLGDRHGKRPPESRGLCLGAVKKGADKERMDQAENGELFTVIVGDNKKLMSR